MHRRPILAYFGEHRAQHTDEGLSDEKICAEFVLLLGSRLHLSCTLFVVGVGEIEVDGSVGLGILQKF